MNCDSGEIYLTYPTQKGIKVYHEKPELSKDGFGNLEPRQDWIQINNLIR